MCPSADDLKSQANWDGATGESRKLLLSELSSKSFTFNQHTLTVTGAISPTVMIPEHRLANIFDQVKQSWKDGCLYHNTMEEPSLYTDHMCDRSDFPCYPDVTFNEHRGEVWFVAFSNGGRYLATAGSDKVVHVYEIQQDGFREYMSFPEHGAGVCFLAWSPDDSKLLSCTREPDNKLRVMDMEEVSFIICHFQC
jgi:WD repeat-containing protein 26